jgi:hypothetical protein
VVISCIRKNRSEVLVNTPPIRPVVVLANIAPRHTEGDEAVRYTGTFAESPT